MLRENGRKDRVPKEFETLIVLLLPYGAGPLLKKGGVGDAAFQELSVFEAVADCLLEAV